MQQSIKRTLIVQIGVVIVLVNTFVGIFFLIFSFKLTEAKFTEDCSQQLKHLGDAFAQQLWLYDLDAINHLAKLAVDSAHINGITLKDHKGKVVVDRDDSETATLELRKKLYYGDSHLVGDIYLSFVNSSWQKERNLIILSGVFAGFTTLTTTFIFLVLLLNIHLIKPLKRLEADMEIIADGDFRPSESTDNKQEVQKIINAFNTMALALDQREKQRQSAEKKLLKSRERSFSLFNSSKDALFSLDKEMKFVDVNPSMVSLLDVEKDNILGKEISTIFVNSDEAHSLLNTVNRHGSISDYSFDLITSNESLKKCLFSSTLWKNEQEEIIGYHGIIRDITEQKLLEERLVQAQKMEAVGTLAGGIAHDFNNILSVILGYADLAAGDAEKDSHLQRDLTEIVKAGNRAKDLVAQILAFSRQTEMQKIPLRVHPLVKEVLKMVRSTMPTTIDIQEDIYADTATIMADPIQVQQIVMNLCTNALHAMENEGGVLSIGLKNTFVNSQQAVKMGQLNKGRYVELQVEDTGDGIPQHQLQRIFDPYFTTKEPGKGTGMGLSIIHGIISEYGGGIVVNSEIGKGTRFTVYFPIAEKAETLKEEETTSVPVGSEHILFVDDEETLAELGVKMLQRLGYTVTVKTNSIEALEAFQNSPEMFDVIITDQTMPGMTGADLARRVLQIKPQMPIILCTGFSNVIDEKKALQLGVKAFAYKPLTKNKLGPLIRSVLDKRG